MDQIVPGVTTLCLLVCMVFAMVARPTARMAPKARPRRREVLTKSMKPKLETSLGTNNVNVTVDTMPAAPMPTSGYLIWASPLVVALLPRRVTTPRCSESNTIPPILRIPMKRAGEL